MSWRNRLFLVTVTFALITVFSSSYGAPPSLEAQQIIERVNTVYRSMQTVQGYFIRESTIEDETMKVVGTFLFKKPDKVSIHNLEPREQYVVSNGQILWLYDKEHGSVTKVAVPRGNAGLDEQVGVGILFAFNPFDQMVDGYDCQRIEDYENQIIIACKPLHGTGAISRVLVKVNPERWTVAAYEIFGPSGQLMTQTKYDDMRQMHNTTWFPFHIETKVAFEKKRFKENVQYSRISVNDTLEDRLFEFTVPKGVRVIEGLKR